MATTAPIRPLSYTTRATENGYTIDHVAGEALPHSLVFINGVPSATGNHTVLNMAAKVRVSNPVAIIKAIGKAILMEAVEHSKMCGTAEAKEAGVRKQLNTKSVLRTHVVCLVDKKGETICKFSVFNQIKTNGKRVTLGDVIKISPSMPLYEYVVNRQASWDSPMVVRALDVWATATHQQLNWQKISMDAVQAAADHNQKMEAAAGIEEAIAAETPQTPAETTENVESVA